MSYKSLLPHVFLSLFWLSCQFLTRSRTHIYIYFNVLNSIIKMFLLHLGTWLSVAFNVSDLKIIERYKNICNVVTQIFIYVNISNTVCPLFTFLLYIHLYTLYYLQNVKWGWMVLQKKTTFAFREEDVVALLSINRKQIYKCF